jgi:hypothetical protein
VNRKESNQTEFQTKITEINVEINAQNNAQSRRREIVAERNRARRWLIQREIEKDGSVLDEEVKWNSEKES